MIENNTTQPGDNPNNYITGLIELDVYKDEQELINAEYNLAIEPTNLYWIGRVDFLRNKILIKKKLEESFRQTKESMEDLKEHIEDLQKDIRSYH